jgi:hypothetical protein
VVAAVDLKTGCGDEVIANRDRRVIHDARKFAERTTFAE